MKQKFLSALLAISLLASLTACSDGGSEESQAVSSDTAQVENVNPDEENASDAPGKEVISIETYADSGSASAPEVEKDSWAIYWYLCGSDLETNHGCATTDLAEMMEVQLPENVNIIIQTGGAVTWQNDLMDPAKIQRWCYSSEGLSLIEECASASMGSAQTLYDFLYFANKNYPADKVAVTFWNHGGGSVTGAAFDELYGNDSLSLNEMNAAFNAVWPADSSAPALEMVGFDTCLMATVDVAAVFSNYAKYLVGSQEVEPGNGWYYTGWMGALASDTTMDGSELGIAICNSFYEGCEDVGIEAQVTLSVTDLSKLPALLTAYEDFGAEAFAAAANDPAFFAQLGRVAAQTENYGGNTKEQGYTNMVDLGHLARQTAWMLPSAQSVTDALEDCIVHTVNGEYRSEATGLSCYYSYNGDIDDLSGYIDNGTGTAFKHLYAFELTGELAEGGDEYLASLDIDAVPEIMTLEDTSWDGAPLTVDDDGTAILELGEDAGDILAGIGFSLYYMDTEGDTMMFLGTDNDINSDWENGIFTDNFRGVWGALDGNRVYMELSFEGEDYNLYSVPVLLNGEPYNLSVAYDFTAEEWSILGASQGIDGSGMASKEMRQLAEGDVISIIWMMTSISGDEDFEMYSSAEITVTADTEFGEAPLFDGSFTMVFEMWDAMGNYACSDPVTFDCENGEIFTTVYED